MSYPTSLDSLPSGHADGVSETIYADTINDLAVAVNAIEAELGLTPSDSFSTVAARLTQIATDIVAIDAAFNVKRDYGAVGDGVADDTTVIQAALDAAAAVGGRVLFPRGTYLVTTLTVGTGVVIQGEGMDLSTIKTSGPASSGSTVLSAAWTDSVIIRDITVDGSSHANVTRVIGHESGDSTKKIRLERVRVQNAAQGPGFYAWPAKEVVVVDCEFVDCVEAIFLDSAEDCVVSRNRITNPGTIGKNGIVTSGGTGKVIIAENRIFDITVDSSGTGVDGHGIQIADTPGVIVEGNYIENTKTAGVHIGSGSYGAKVIGNEIVTPGQLNAGGIYAEIIFGDTTIPADSDEAGCVIQGNNISDSNGYGIAVSYSAGTIVSGNRVVNCHDEGIVCDSDRCVIADNFCLNNKRVGGGTSSQIHLYSGVRCVISGNVCYDSAATKLCAYGLDVGDDTHVIIGNQLAGHLTGGMLGTGGASNEEFANVTA